MDPNFIGMLTQFAALLMVALPVIISLTYIIVKTVPDRSEQFIRQSGRQGTGKKFVT